MEQTIPLLPLGCVGKQWEFRQIPKGMDGSAEERWVKCQRRESGPCQWSPGGGGSPSRTQVLRPAKGHRHGDADILEPPPLTATRFRCVGAF